ncbi:MAG: hypothetical protein IJS59_00080 [Bacteroidaceae bacterium]|nr:hypothetical protein [Bacteroidaceae bacterium]
MATCRGEQHYLPWRVTLLAAAFVTTADAMFMHRRRHTPNSVKQATPDGDATTSSRAS